MLRLNGGDIGGRYDARASRTWKLKECGVAFVVAVSERLGEHTCARPRWDCRACGNSWPCADAKAELLREFRTFPSDLRTFLAGQMCDAIDDLTVHGGPVPPDLYGRFLGWIRLRPRRNGHPVAWSTSGGTGVSGP